MNKFNLKNFLVENKLTKNSRAIQDTVEKATIEEVEIPLEEDFAPSPNSDVPEANAEEFDIATAFEKARVDMSKPVTVHFTYGSATYGGDESDEMSAEAAIKKLEAERQDRSKQYTDDGEEVPEDHHAYEFENSSVLEEDMPEGHEYKLAYFQTGDAEWAITQEKSGVSEVEDVEDGRDIGGKIIEFADGGNVNINIDYQRGKTKDFKDVPVEKAIDIVNQYIDQNDLTQASTDETNRILQVDDGDTAIDITKAGMSEEEETVEGNYEKTEAPVSEEEVYEGTWEDIETDEVAVETLNKIIADHGLKQVKGYFEIAEDKVTQHYLEEIVGKFGLEAVKDWIKNA